MLLGELLQDVKPEYSKTEIKGVTSDSREVKDGYAFVCINGVGADGHDFANDAVLKGASVIIAEKDLGLHNQIIVSNTRKVYADMCAAWFGFPAKKLRLIGVTGTNGKTSVTYMLKSIIEKAGYKTGLIGTIQNMIGDKVVDSKNTTPGAYQLNELFYEMVKSGCKYCVMEVSSHALDQYRVGGIHFDTALFTNLTQDHLDYHKTMENYFSAKKKLFSMCKTAVINIDDKYGKELASQVKCDVVTCSVGDNADFSARSIKYRPDSVEYELLYGGKLTHIKVLTGGEFSVYNSLLSAAAAVKTGIDISYVQSALSEMQGVKGRAESVFTGKDFSVIIDYAHTPDGLKNILSTFAKCDKNRLILLFGCGGDRDKTKRPIMGNIAVRGADYVIVTSDNPRTEEPMSIINDILEGTKGYNTPVKVIENRIEAIQFAINMAKSGDIILLAGKGHETYQILKDRTVHLDEREIVRAALI